MSFGPPPAASPGSGAAVLDPDFALLARLSEAPGVSGDEGAVRRILTEAVRDRVDALRTDTIGNLFTLKRGTDASSAFPVLVAAHMDEVGLMVTEIGEDGALAFEVVGGIDARVLASQALRVGADAVPGVVGLKPTHLAAPGEKDQVPTVKGLRIDIGAEDKAAAARLVRRGDYAVFDTALVDLGPTLLGKAFDDRGGCAILAALLEDRQAYDLHAVFTVQEEVGLRGARVAAHAVAPRAAFVLECGTTDDSPRKRDDTPVMRLGAGPAITVMDRSMIADRGLVRHLVATAEARGIPYQIRAPKGGGTDGGRIHLARAGVPTAVVSLPCRYLHAPASLISKSDFRHALALMRAALETLTPEVVQR